MIQIESTKSTQSPFRFNIKRRLYELDPREKNAILKKIKEEKGLSRDTLRRYISERKKDNSMMKADVLQAFAVCFNCSMDDLINK